MNGPFGQYWTIIGGSQGRDSLAKHNEVFWGSIPLAGGPADEKRLK